MKRAALVLIALAGAGSAGSAGCFGARAELRSYFVLAGEPGDLERREQPIFHGLVRVRNLNAEDVYDKFQIVVRRSPYELHYSDANVWAVKPYQMVSDIIARRLVESNAFSSATRELGDTRPEFTLGGELHAIEVYDSNDVWYAHLAITLTLVRFSDGERLWSMRFDERKEIASQNFSHAVRTISELLDRALEQGLDELERVAHGEKISPPLEEPENMEKKPPPSEEPIYVPEKGT